MRLRSSTGYAERVVDLSAETSPTLTFWAKADSFETGETASLLISDDGVSYTTVKTWVDGEDTNSFQQYSFDLSAYTLSSTFYIAFDANMSSTGDYFYVDNLQVVKDVVNPNPYATVTPIPTGYSITTTVTVLKTYTFPAPSSTITLDEEIQLISVEVDCPDCSELKIGPITLKDYKVRR